MPRNSSVAVTAACVLLLVAVVSAQPPDTLWTRFYGTTGNDIARRVVPTFDDGCLVAGSTVDGQSRRVFAVRLDAEGNELWRYTDGYVHYVQDAQQTPDSGFVLVGGAMWETSGFVCLVRLDGGGERLWTRYLGRTGTWSSSGSAVRPTPDSGFVIAGTEQGWGGGHESALLIKTDAEGGLEWEKAWPGMFGYDVTLAADSGFVVAGMRNTPPHGFVLRLDAQGDSLWRTDLDHSVTRVNPTSDGGFVALGSSSPDWHQRLVRLDSLGGVVWQRQYEKGRYGYAPVWETWDRGFVFAGGMEREPSVHDLLLTRTDSKGDTLWTLTIGTDSTDEFVHCLALTAGSGYLTAGTSYRVGEPDYNFWVVRFGVDSTGIVEAPHAPRVQPGPRPTLVRGSLNLPRMTNDQLPMTMLDASGRKVMELRPGENDVRHLAPGVYFVRVQGPRGQASKGSSAKVVIQR